MIRVLPSSMGRHDILRHSVFKQFGSMKEHTQFALCGSPPRSWPYRGCPGIMSMSSSQLAAYQSLHHSGQLRSRIMSSPSSFLPRESEHELSWHGCAVTLLANASQKLAASALRLSACCQITRSTILAVIQVSVWRGKPSVAMAEVTPGADHHR
jgi:hypothetical protein